MFCDCKLAGLGSVTKQELVMATETISHYDQTSMFLSLATGNKVQCFTAPEQITHDDIYQLGELQINHLSLFLFLQNKLRSETWFQAVNENLKTHIYGESQAPPQADAAFATKVHTASVY